MQFRVISLLFYHSFDKKLCDSGLSEDADIDDVVGVFKATPRYTPSDIIYHLEFPVTMTRTDNSILAVPNDMFRLESTSSGAVIYVNKLNSTYNLQDARQFNFRVVATDQARMNATKTVAVTVLLFINIAAAAAAAATMTIN